MESLDYQVFTHATQAQQRGLAYRLEETNTAAGRGADGVSNVAASATYALDMMFHVACPQPPNLPGANADCATQGVGVNLHNAEVRAFFEPQEGNAYYNAVNYDTTPAMGAPTAAPLYYALLMFSGFAQGASGLRPVDVTATVGTDSGVKGWRVEGAAGERRLFLINKSDAPRAVTVSVPAASVLVDRMTPSAAGSNAPSVSSPQVTIDGRQVDADGRWPGFAPTTLPVHGDRAALTLAPGEAVVLTLHDR